MSSQYFWNSTLKGLTRFADVFIPENGDMPSFSQFGCIEKIDTVIAYLPTEDIGLLNMVLTALSIMPNSFLQWLVTYMENSLDKQGTIPSLLRQLNMGLRGIIFALYYSESGGTAFKGNTPLDVIGYHLNRVEN